MTQSRVSPQWFTPPDPGARGTGPRRAASGSSSAQLAQPATGVASGLAAAEEGDAPGRGEQGRQPRPQDQVEGATWSARRCAAAGVFGPVQPAQSDH